MAAISALAGAGAWSAPESFPTARPSTRLQAVTILTSGAPLATGCATPLADAIERDPTRAAPASRRALTLLQADRPLAGERRHLAAEGVVVRYTVERGALDRADGPDGDGDGVPDLVEAAGAGAAAAREFLLRRLDFPAAPPLEVVLARLGSGIDGLLATARDGRRVALVDASARGGADAVRRSAAHQAAHAIAEGFGPGLTAAWGEALATWTGLALDAGTEERTLQILARRLARLEAGLDPETLEDASGNAVWLAFLHDAYGPTALRVAMDEMARGGPAAAAFDRALRRTASSGFDEAIREFHVWAVLTGDRDDRRHFAFASRLPSPDFAARVDGLPVLSVLGEPALGPSGLTQILIGAPEPGGGLVIRFEGELGAKFAADLLLVRDDGALRRVAVDLDAEGRGEAALPIQGLREALLLVRNVDRDDGAERRYSWSAMRDPAYPWEPGTVSATAGIDGSVQVAWDTASESAVLGFNVLRRREGDARAVRVNPVWVPAIGDRSTAAQYAFVDATALPGVAYEYRIEAVTPLGLTAASEPAAVPAPR